MRLTPITQVRGKTVVLQGLVNRQGEARDLIGFNDSLTFRIANKDTMAAVITKTISDGITADSTGRYSVRLAPEETTAAAFPLDEYWFELEITEGDTGEEYPVRRGPWYWEPSPN